MAKVYFSTPITNPRNPSNDAETAFQEDLTISNANAMPGNFMDETSIHLLNLDLTEKDVADCSFLTSTTSQKIQEERKVEPSHIPIPFQKLKIDPQKKLNNPGAATKGKLHSSSQQICQNKYSCENCQQFFKNSILLQRHVCPNVIKRQRGVFSKTMNNAVSEIKEKRPEDSTKSTLNATKSTLNTTKSTLNTTRSTLNATLNDKVLFYKTREGMYTPRKSLMTSVSTNKSPALKVGKRFTCKNCDMKFASHMLLNLHMRKMCVAPLKKVPMTNSLIPGLNKTIVGESTTIQHLINTQIKKNGFAVDAAITMTKQKTPVVRRYKDLGGIPVSSKLNLAFQNMKMRLQSVTSPVENTDADKSKMQ